MIGDEPQFSVEIRAVLDAFELADGSYKRAEVVAAVERQEEITPALLWTLEKTLESPGEYANDERCFGPTYALMLLGYFREPRAHQLLIDLVSLPNDLPHGLFDDLVSEEFPYALFETCDGRLDAIKGLVLNKDANAYARSAGAHALTYAVAEGVAPREEIVKFLGDAFNGWETDDTEDEVYSFLAGPILDLCPLELMESLQAAFREGVIMSFFLNEQDVEIAASLGPEGCISRLQADLDNRSRTDIHARMQSWGCFTGPAKPMSSPKFALPLSLPEMGTKVHRDGKKSEKRKLEKHARKKNRKKKH